VQHGRATLEDDATIVLSGHFFQIILPVGKPFRDAYAGIDVQEICVDIGSANHNAIDSGIAPDNGPENRIFDACLTPSFVEFYEAYKPWIVETYGKARANWPMPFQFGAVIRDAISHRKVKIDNHRTAVSWAGLSFSSADNGTEIVGPKLIYADILALMFDLATELDAHGAPEF